MLEGPIVDELFNAFRQSWNKWGREKIYFQENEKGINLLKRKERLLSGSLSLLKNGVGIPALPIFVYSVKGRRRMRSLLRYSIMHAQKNISLTTAYFTPSQRMITSLEKAVKRGVDVRLLVPGKSDVPAASYAGRAFFARLLKAKVKIYTYLGEMLHAKTYLFDQCWSIIGSTNLDYQSLMYNDEGNVGILDQEFASKMSVIFEEDLKNSVQIEKEKWSSRPFSEKVKEYFFALFRKRL
jgi:phosphatidylserine/phosphatidylglycerophosphate/cardiolipin synthase-like enzyme